MGWQKFWESWKETGENRSQFFQRRNFEEEVMLELKTVDSVYSYFFPYFHFHNSMVSSTVQTLEIWEQGTPTAIVSLKEFLKHNKYVLGVFSTSKLQYWATLGCIAVLQTVIVYCPKLNEQLIRVLPLMLWLRKIMNHYISTSIFINLNTILKRITIYFLSFLTYSTHLANSEYILR